MELVLLGSVTPGGVQGRDFFPKNVTTSQVTEYLKFYHNPFLWQFFLENCKFMIDILKLSFKLISKMSGSVSRSVK